MMDGYFVTREAQTGYVWEAALWVGGEQVATGYGPDESEAQKVALCVWGATLPVNPAIRLAA